MDSEEPREPCDNCGKQIVSTNMFTHTIYCLKNIQKCPDCQQPVVIQELDDHIKEMHTKNQCTSCGESFSKAQLQDHELKTCSERLIDCSYCENRIPFKQYFAHQNVCGSRTNSCQICSKFVPIRALQFHTAICKINKSKQSPDRLPNNPLANGKMKQFSQQDDFELAVLMSLKDFRKAQK